MILTDYDKFEVYSVLANILREEFNSHFSSFYRFLCILNSIGAQNKQLLKKESRNISYGQVNQSYIAKLPNELLIKILSYLSTEDLRENVALVSKHFKELCKSPLVHQIVTTNAVSPERSCTEAQFLRGATMMTEFHQYSFFGGVFQEETRAISKHCHLKVLHVHGYVYFDTESFYSLASSKFWENLSHLHMEVKIQQFRELVKLRHFKLIMSKLGSKGILTHLDFGRLKGCDEDSSTQVSIFNLFKGPNMKQLKNLTIYKFYSQSQMLKIVKGRKETLEELKIYNNSSNFDFLNLCPKIKHLAIEQTLLKDLLKILPKLKNLISLEIFQTRYYGRHVVDNDKVDLLQITKVLLPDSIPSLTSLKLNMKHNQAEVKI